MKAGKTSAALFFCALLALGCWVFLGCELESANSVTREADIYVAGVYEHPTAGSLLVSENSGEPITRFDLRQSGDQIEAIDNNDSVWRGTLGKESDTLASFTLSGKTTAGEDATADGTIETSGGSATMRGTWVEASVYGVIYGVATVPTNGGGGTYTLTTSVSPSGAGTVALSPSGGSYSPDTVVTLTASASSGHTFSAWSGDLTGSANPGTITMNGNKTVTANFTTP